MKKFFLFAILPLVAAVAMGCASVPKSIPEDLSSSELVQRAQEATDAYNYDAAIAYYQAAIDRFGGDPAIMCMGEYEIAFIYYKQGKYAQSAELFEKLLARYAAPGGESLPARYQIPRREGPAQGQGGRRGGHEVGCKRGEARPLPEKDRPAWGGLFLPLVRRGELAGWRLTFHAPAPASRMRLRDRQATGPRGHGAGLRPEATARPGK